MSCHASCIVQPNADVDRYCMPHALQGFKALYPPGGGRSAVQVRQQHGSPMIPAAAAGLWKGTCCCSCIVLGSILLVVGYMCMKCPLAHSLLRGGPTGWWTTLTKLCIIPTYAAHAIEARLQTSRTNTKLPGPHHHAQVLADDLDRLEEMEFLNDTIIDYYMRCVVGN